MACSYTPKDLREQFFLDDSVSDYILSPLLQVAFFMFFNKLKEDPKSIGVTDTRFHNRRSSTLVINGKIVCFGCNPGYDIDGYDLHSPWRMTNHIGFGEGDIKDDIEAQKLLQKFTEFIAEISSKKLHEHTADFLRDDRRRLDNTIEDFYFPKED